MKIVLRNSKFIKAFFTIAFLFIISNGFSATYYSKPTGNANLFATWGNNPNGSGTAPTSFTTSGDTFILNATSALTTNNNWIIGAGVTLRMEGTLSIGGNNRSVTINGIVIFTNPSATQVSMAGAGGGNFFIMSTGSFLVTSNVNGIQGTNCSLPANATKKTVTLSNGVNYEFNASSAQLTLGLPLTSIANLKINNAAGVTLSAPTSVFTLTIGDVSSNTIFNDGGNQINCTGQLNLINNSTFKLGGTNATTFPTFAVFNITAGSTVEYAAAVAQTISAEPNTYSNIIISGAGLKTATGNLTVANDFTVQAGSSFEVASGSNLTVGNVVTNNAGTANFVVQNNANLLQVNDVNNSGEITVKRESNALFRLDYTMWSSPVSGAQTLGSFSPLTNTTRFYTYDSGTNTYSGVLSPATTTFTTGIGYLIRMPNEDPSIPGGASPYALGTAAITYNGVFTGTPNNGDVSIGVGTGTYNAIGNPYPSAIVADQFMSGNAINTLYFWRKKNNAATTSYATYTTAGGVGTGANSGDPLGDPNGIVPNGVIQVGQGFIVQPTSSPVIFNNLMRVANNANQFLKTTTIERHRVWLNLSKPNGGVNQMMVAYMTNATSGIDAAIDGQYINDSQTALTSIINTQEYTIQGRALPFSASDVVSLGFKSTTAGTFTIAIDHVDGLFTNGQAVYLKDNLTNTTHNLTDGAYTFVTEAGVFNSRFELVYQMVLGTKDTVFNENNVIVYQNNGLININSGTLIIDNVKVFDISGRLLVELSNIDASQAMIDGSKFANQVLLVQVSNKDGLKVTKKVIN